MNPKRLYLSKNKVIGGVAGGIAEYTGIDPTLVRLIWAFSVFAGGAGLFVYVVAMIIIPEQPHSSSSQVSVDNEQNQEAIEDLKQAAQDLAESSGEVAQEVAERVRRSVDRIVHRSQDELDEEIDVDTSKPVEQTSNYSNRNLGLILLIIGFIFLFRNVLPWIPWGFIWPLGLILLGAMYIFRGVGGR